MTTDTPHDLPMPAVEVYPMPRRWHVGVPGAGAAVVEAITRDDAIAAFKKRTGVISPPHQHDVTQLT